MICLRPLTAKGGQGCGGGGCGDDDDGVDDDDDDGDDEDDGDNDEDDDDDGGDDDNDNGDYITIKCTVNAAINTCHFVCRGFPVLSKKRETHRYTRRNPEQKWS